MEDIFSEMHATGEFARGPDEPIVINDSEVALSGGETSFSNISEIKK